MKLAISGASGKTGFRIAEESLKAGHQVLLLLRKGSIVPETLKSCDQKIIDLSEDKGIDNALRGYEALIIATGARPSIDLTGPARVDAFGVKKQVASCQRMGVKRLVLVSSLCAGRFLHPLNLFGLILIWKRIGENALETSGLDWTVIRPGGLTEKEDGLSQEAIFYTGPDEQEEAYIPRRLVARACVEALNTQSSIGKIIEITSSPDTSPTTMKKAIEDFVQKPS